MQDKTIVYLDWNILNKLWNKDAQAEKDRPALEQLERIIDAREIIVPYSNAHIRDLSRGVIKKPEYTEHHISTIKRATGDLCITQYWGQTGVTWHYRDSAEFLDSTLNVEKPCNTIILYSQK